MKTFESLLEPRAQLVKKCREASKDSVAATRRSLDHAQQGIRGWVDLERMVGVEFPSKMVMLANIPAEV